MLDFKQTRKQYPEVYIHTEYQITLKLFVNNVHMKVGDGNSFRALTYNISRLIGTIDKLREEDFTGEYEYTNNTETKATGDNC